MITVFSGSHLTIEAEQRLLCGIRISVQRYPLVLESSNKVPQPLQGTSEREVGEVSYIDIYLFYLFYLI